MPKRKHQWQSEHPSKYELVVISANIRSFGIHEVSCRIEETKGDGSIVRGSEEMFGIEPVALKQRHNNSVDEWRAWIYGEMKERHIRQQTVHAEILRWKGQRYSPTI